jgi:CPA2 family monovalent cation:H+ antiporter-2
VILLQLGLIIFMAFLGAVIARRFGHSVIIAYILIGVIIGPYGPLPWKIASVDDVQTGFVYLVAKIGLIMMIFFVGLEFSLQKLKETGVRVAALAAVDIGTTFFLGFVVCAYFGMNFVDSFFFSCIISMSSVAITMKVIDELGWGRSKVASSLIGLMIVEDLVSILLLTMAGSFAMGSDNSQDLLFVVVTLAVLITFYMFLALAFVPKVLSHIEKVKHEELFILFALGTIFLSAALAEALGVSAIIGAFFIGMVFAETKLAPRLKERTITFRDAFAAMFFVAFGMSINPSGIPGILPLLLVIVPLVIVCEVVFVAVTAYSLGHSADESMAVASGTISRSDESVIFAKMGSEIKQPDGNFALGAEARDMILPFAGAYCFIMSALTPIFIKRARGAADFFGRRLPAWMKESGKCLSDLLGELAAPSADKTKESRGRLGLSAASILIYAILLMSVSPSLDLLVSTEPDLVFVIRIAMLAGAFALPIGLWMAMRSALMPAGATEHSRRRVSFVSGMVAGLGLAVLLIALAWSYWYLASVIVLLCFISFLLAGSWAFGSRARVLG